MQIKNLVEKHGRSQDKLIRILMEYQKSRSDNFLSEEDLRNVAHEMNLPESRVSSVAEFYSLISTKPRGKYIVQVCRDVPCHVNGSVDIVKELERRLKVKMGETTQDGVFTLEYSSCLGCCDMSPAVRIEEEVYGNLTPDKIAKIMSKYRRKCDE